VGEGFFFHFGQRKVWRPLGTALIGFVAASVVAGAGSHVLGHSPSGELTPDSPNSGRKAVREARWERGAAVPEACRVKLQRA
jgi:hypothetical protein